MVLHLPQERLHMCKYGLNSTCMLSFIPLGNGAQRKASADDSIRFMRQFSKSTQANNR